MQASTVCCRCAVVTVSCFEVIWLWSQICLVRMSAANDEWKFSSMFGCDAISQPHNLAYCRHVFSSTASGNQVEPRKLLSSSLQQTDGGRVGLINSEKRILQTQIINALRH
ncbi:ATP-dependent RNA helicase SUV3 [Trichinella pseudospiralis]|uniref:Uncharacterized protein n=1 Tax=Trichinella pseudospiralis TaxID=6337 RepID=A0A0V0Y091_TRIPS|nr:hypothetical protein T4E_3303 [Trichinella pseudospiralis]